MQLKYPSPQFTNKLHIFRIFELYIGIYGATYEHIVLTGLTAQKILNI